MKNILFLILAFCLYTDINYADIAWSSPVSISTGLANATDPNVTIDSSGNATAIWVQSNIIQTASLPFGGTWTTPVALSNVANVASRPRLGVNGSGAVTAVWIENTILQTATLNVGGSWSAAIPISGFGVTEFSLDVDTAGNAAAVWVRSGNIEASRRSSGIWSLVSVLSTLVSSSSPHVKISSNGQAIAVWHSLSSGSDIIVSNILTISVGTWGVNKNVTAPSTSYKYNYPKVTIDSNGNATVAAYRYNFNSTTGAYYNVQVITSTLTNGAAAWGLGTILSTNGIGNPANLSIKLRADINGDVLAIWTNLYDGMTYSIESSNKVFGGNWPNAITPQSFSLYSFGIDLAVSQGSALLVNMAWDGISNITILSQETDMTDPLAQGWTNTNQFSIGSYNANPACALTVSATQAKACAVWINYNGTKTNINASNGSDTVIPAPSGLTATQNSINLGVYTDYYNTLNWSASPDPTLLQYNIYRNGSFFAATPPGTLTFNDHNQVQSGTVTYGVSALDQNYRQSAMVTFTLF